MENKLSFTKQIKEEITSNLELSKERKTAILSAFVKNVGVFRITNGSTLVILKTDSAKVAKFIYYLSKDLYGIVPKFAYEQHIKFKEKTYFVLYYRDRVDEFLDNLKINFFNKDVDEIFYSNEEYKYGYICGTFLANGSCNDPSSSNYHLELAFDDGNIAVELQRMINDIKQLDFNMRIIKRRNKIVLYMKKSDLISSFLVLIGAVNSCLTFENTRIERDFANIDNRMLNLDGANYRKIMDTSKKQISNIKLIERKMGISSIPSEKMRLLCHERLKNEEASLKELADILSEKLEIKVSKSNIVHMFNKIESIAQELSYDED